MKFVVFVRVVCYSLVCNLLSVFWTFVVFRVSCSVDCCVSHGVRWLFLLLLVVSLVVARRVLFVACFCVWCFDCCCLVFSVVCRCVLFVVCYVLTIDCLLLFVVRCVWFVVGWSLSGVRCCLCFWFVAVCGVWCPMTVC